MANVAASSTLSCLVQAELHQALALLRMRRPRTALGQLQPRLAQRLPMLRTLQSARRRPTRPLMLEMLSSSNLSWYASRTRPTARKTMRQARLTSSAALVPRVVFVSTQARSTVHLLSSKIRARTQPLHLTRPSRVSTLVMRPLLQLQALSSADSDLRCSGYALFLMQVFSFHD
jgi:hypothetical protein